MRNQKATFKKLFAGVAILLAVLPLVVTFSAVLTEVFSKVGAYVWLQDQIVPFEARIVAVLLRGVNITGVVTPGASFSMLLDRPGQSPLPVLLSWNCLGWQSLVLLGLTFATGLKGGWKRLSKAETIVLGVVGTFLINVFRMAFITSLAYYWNSVAAMIIHDYFAAFIALIWLIFFWWFSYSFILEPKKVATEKV